MRANSTLPDEQRRLRYPLRRRQTDSHELARGQRRQFGTGRAEGTNWASESEMVRSAVDDVRRGSARTCGTGEGAGRALGTEERNENSVSYRKPTPGWCPVRVLVCWGKGPHGACCFVTGLDEANRRLVRGKV